MRTSFIYFRSTKESKSFVYPCFNTSLSREEIIAYILSCPTLLGDIDILDYQFRFIGPLRNGKSRLLSATYCVDVDHSDFTTTHIRLVRISASNSLFSKRNSFLFNN